MRYLAIAAIIFMLILLFGPVILSAGRNVAQQAKQAWRKK